MAEISIPFPFIFILSPYSLGYKKGLKLEARAPVGVDGEGFGPLGGDWGLDHVVSNDTPMAWLGKVCIGGLD